MESSGTAAKSRGRRCAANTKHTAQPGKDLCEPCEAAFRRTYPDLAGGTKEQDQGKKDDMATKKTAEKTGAANKGSKGTVALTTLPEALRALEPADLADKLYEVAAGDTAPDTYALPSRGAAVDALRAMGKDHKTTLARAEHAFDEREAAREADEAKGTSGEKAEPEAEKKDEKPAAPAKKAPAKKKAGGKPAPIDLPGGEDEEPAGEPGKGTPEPEKAGAAEEGGKADEEPVPPSDPKAAVRGGGAKGTEGATPAWRSSPARLLKAALGPLDDKWCDWDALEKAGLKGVKAARHLLKQALEHQERVEAAAKGGGKAPAAKGEVKAGATVRVKAKHAKDYEGALSAEEQASLKVEDVKGTVAHCKTPGGERAIVPVTHLEVVPAAA